MEISPLILILWGELTFFLAGGLFLILMNGFLKSRQGKKSVKGLLDKVKADRSRRLEEIKSGLAAYGIEGDALEQKVAQIDKQELKLYQRISSMYRLRRDAMLSNINIAVEASSKPYFDLGLNLKGSSTSKETSQDTEIDNTKLDELREKNESLKAELSVTMDTIGRMLSEYSSMFGAEDEGELDKGKIMEAFEVDENSNDNVIETDPESLDEVVETDELLEIEEDFEEDELLEVEDLGDSDELLEVDDMSDMDDLFNEAPVAGKPKNDEVSTDEAITDDFDLSDDVDDDISDMDDLFNQAPVVGKPKNDEVSTDEAITDDFDLPDDNDISDIDDLFNEAPIVDKPIIDEASADEVIPDDIDLFDEVADDIEVDELDEVVDIETNLDLPDENEVVDIEADPNLPNEDELVKVEEDIDEFDIDALIDGGVDSSNKKS